MRNAVGQVLTNIWEEVCDPLMKGVMLVQFIALNLVRFLGTDDFHHVIHQLFWLEISSSQAVSSQHLQCFEDIKFGICPSLPRSSSVLKSVACILSEEVLKSKALCICMLEVCFEALLLLTWMSCHSLWRVGIIAPSRDLVCYWKKDAAGYHTQVQTGVTKKPRPSGHCKPWKKATHLIAAGQREEHL